MRRRSCLRKQLGALPRGPPHASPLGPPSSPAERHRPPANRSQAGAIQSGQPPWDREVEQLPTPPLEVLPTGPANGKRGKRSGGELRFESCPEGASPCEQEREVLHPWIVPDQH